MNINKYLIAKGYNTVDSSFFSAVEVWKQFYRGRVRGFHNYKVYNGKTHVNQKRYSLSMAKKLCEDMADLLLNEHVGIVLSDKSSQRYVDEVLKANHFDIKGNECQEIKSYCGTVAYVPNVENAVTDESGELKGGSVLINYVPAEDIRPLAWTNGEVTECAFIYHHVIKGKEYAHVQFHLLQNGLYVIENHVVECSTKEAGNEIPPEKWAELKPFASMAERVETGSDKRQFVIDRLNLANNFDINNPMGVSIYANALDDLKAIDVIYDSYVNEFMLGKKRIYVTPDMLNRDMMGRPAFDTNDVVFYMLPEELRDGSKPILESNMSIRSNEHNVALNDLLNVLSVKTGFGTKHYQFETGNISTATEVISENSDMFRTLKKHEIILEQALTELIRIILRLGKVTGANVEPDADITVSFDDSIIEDRNAERERDRADVAMGAMTLAEYRAKWYNEDLETAKNNVITDGIEADGDEE